MGEEATLTKDIKITYNVVTGEIQVIWDELSYAELLGLMEHAKMMLYKDYMED